MDISKLKKIIEIKNPSPKGLAKTIFEQEDGQYILRAAYKGDVQWIKMGHCTDFFDQEKDWKFQVVFHVSTAIEYGYQLPCGFEGNIDPYKNLTCNPATLKHLEKISEKNYLGAYVKKDIYECPKCKNIWRIVKNYDSHRGYWNNCFLEKGSRK